MRRGFRMLGVAAGSVALVASAIGIAQASAGGSPSPTPTVKGAPVRPAQGKPAPLRRVAAATTDLNEAVFTPITPCRIVNTRAAGGRVTSAGRSFSVAGTANFVAQGGTSGGCGIPASTTAVSANLVAVDGTTSGYLRAYPAGATPPNASVLNYQTSTLANDLSLAITPGTAPALTVTASSPVDIIIDITGYYQQPIVAYTLAAGTAYSSTRRILSATRISQGVYQFTVDRDITNCAASAVVGVADAYASVLTDASAVTVRTWTLSTTAQIVYTDREFNLTVIC